MKFLYTSKKIGDILINKAVNQYTMYSQRLDARSLNQFDEQHLMAQYSGLLQNPENTSLFADGNPWSDLAVSDFIRQELGKWNSGNGLAVFSLFNSSSQEFMGYLQLKHALDDFKDVGAGHKNVAEIAYMLDKPFWGQGYGTEIAILGKKFIKHRIEHAPENSLERSIKEIVATVHPMNEGSKRILQKTLKQQEPEEFTKFGGQPRILFFKPLTPTESSIIKKEDHPLIPFGAKL